MSSAYTFKWPAGPEEVIVTGSFDNWTKSLSLVKQSDGSFELTVPFGEDVNVLYKYLVDGKWLTNPTQSLSTDSEGNENNILISDHLFSYEAQSKIPEAGGLAVVPGSLQTTVMPSAEAQQTTLGEAGIFVPKDKDSLAAFSVYENTDRNLNEKPEQEVVLTSEEKKKQKKKLKRTKYKLNKKAKAVNASGDVSSTSPETTPIPEADKLMDAEKEAVAPVTDDVPMTTVVNTVSEPMTPKEEASEPSTSLKTEETVTVEEEKEPAPYALSEEDIPQSTMAPVPVAMSHVDTTEPEKESAAYTFTGNELEQPIVKPAEDMAVDTETASTPSKDVSEMNNAVEEENNTLDPTVVGSSGVTAAVSETMLEAPEMHAGNTSDEMTMAPVVDEPVMEEPVMEEPVMEEPVMEEPVMEKPVMEKPVMEEPVVEEPAMEEPVMEEPVMEEPVMEEPVMEEPVMEEPVMEEPVMEEPVMEEPVIDEPVMEEPVVLETGPAHPVQLAPDSNMENIPVAPVSQHTKEATASPMNDNMATSGDEIIIAQGGHDRKEIEQQIAAEEKGPVCIEEIQPTVSEAKNLAEEAHIPRDEIKAASVPEKSEDAMSSAEKTSDNGKSSTEGMEKKKKKRSFFSKLKKIFK